MGVTTREAGDALALGRARVQQLIASGELEASRVKGVWLVEVSSLQRLVAARAAWVTINEAAEIVGCTTTRIRRAVSDGVVEQRAVLRAPTIRRSDLDRLSPLVQIEREVKRLRRSEREEAATRPRRGDPPDADHQWWALADVADVLGLSTSRIHQLATSESLPATRQAGRLWFRVDHVLQVLSARAFRIAARRPQSE